MENNIYKVDLHIHTPASKCYKGKKVDEEYLRIIKKAKQEKIKIIAFIDHNSIDGFKKYKERKEKLEQEKATLLMIKDSKQSKKKIITIDKSLKLLNDVLVLPGIEFEVSDAIHFLVIFDDETSIKQIDNLLKDGGYDEEQSGLETPTRVSNWSILQFLDILKKYNCITICSHVDSNKGVYNDIKPGALRAKCLSSELLNGIEYNSEVTKDKIASIIKDSKEYQRKTPLAFVRFSDAHNIDEIGRSITYIKLIN